MYKVLLVEDNPDNCDMLCAFLNKAKCYETAVAHDAETALALVQKETFDIILMDIMLPGMDGISLCERIRKSTYCPVIFVSCLDDEETILRAFSMGGDDYITKPFRYAVLCAHMEAVLRRFHQSKLEASGDIRIGDIVLSVEQHAVIKGGRTINLSTIEFDILRFLASNPNRTLRFDDIYRNVWKQDSYGDFRTVFTHVRNLRKKIEDDPSAPRYIITVARDGYLLKLD